ncbi:MAG TPA: type II secretion system F family protein [Opitutaceae bacterium]|nr:type II secretion system F family protein [Opitutaceae bacterium]
MEARPMPLSHHRLASWYVQLAQQLEAGLPFADALRSIHASGSFGRVVARMAGRIDQGGNVDDALREAAASLPASDQLVLSAAGEAGRLPQTLRHLASRHQQLSAAQLRIALACAYPLGILHLGLLLLPVVRMIDWQKGFHWDAMAYARGLAETLIPLWLLLGVLVFLARRHSPILRSIGRLMPALGSYLKAQALADLSFTLRGFLEAGVPVGDAWAAVGLVSRSPELRHAAEAMAAVVEQGQAPGTRLPSWPCFPPEFSSQYRTGETTGQLEANLHRLGEQYQDSANRALTLATMLYPALMFLVVAGGVVYFVISIYSGYLTMLTKLAQ